MYEIDDKDKIAELTDVPQSSVGAPIPFLMQDEHTAVLTYYLEQRSRDWDGSTVRVVGPVTADEPIAIVRFSHCYATMFGPPNDESFNGHPLAARGLAPYRAFRVENSSWLRGLERRNSAHPRHDPNVFLAKEHFVWAFHDSTFECICKGYEISLVHGSIDTVTPAVKAQFAWAAEK
ncbi:MAG: hypothetical protein U0136_16095 [Bdellovibrionota bacterium]